MTSTQRHISWLRTTLLALFFTWLATPLAFGRQLSTSSVFQCVAPYNKNGVACIGVEEVNEQGCANFASYNGKQGQHFVDSTQTYCFVPYTSTCQQSITILSQEGKGTFSVCDQADTDTADRIMSDAISQGLISVSGSPSTPSSPSCSTTACIAQNNCNNCRSTCQALEVSIKSSGVGVLPASCSSGCRCCSTGNVADCS